MLVTLNAFAHGDALYKDIFSPYGPFFFEFFGGLFSLSGHAVTTDASRPMVIVIWVATSFLLGLACQRLTGRLRARRGGDGRRLRGRSSRSSPSRCTRTACSCCCSPASSSSRSAGRDGAGIALGGAVAGALLAAALMTKINFGAYAIAAVVLAAALTWSSRSTAAPGCAGR